MKIRSWQTQAGLILSRSKSHILLENAGSYNKHNDRAGVMAIF